ncbi:MAG: glycosyltransferase family 4 protein [Lachnospiraceae bacterium]|nr:glycosyltransferase family 4 protein [Lachnospiraceae bacterium]
MNILLVHNYYQIPGGEDTVVKNEYELLKSMGHDVSLYTRHNDEIKSFSLLKKMLLPFTFIYSFRTKKEITDLIRKKHIDVVMVHNTLSLISPSVYYAAVKCKVPVIQTIHNFRLLCPAATLYRDGHICEDCLNKGFICALKHRCYRGSFIQTLISAVSALIHRKTGIYGRLNYICLTGFNKKKLLSLKQIQPDKVFIKPNFTSRVSTIVPYDKRDNRFVYAGRLDELKGVRELFEAWKVIEMNTEEVPILDVCGLGPLEEWCRAFIKENDMKSIRMHGAVSHDAVMMAVSAAKAGILLCKWYEPFGMSVIEAFSVGTPMIVTSIGSPKELIKSAHYYGNKDTTCFTTLGALIPIDNTTGSLADTIMNWDAFKYDEGSMQKAAAEYGEEENKRIFDEILKNVILQNHDDGV